jgi:HAD superfamily hydrolase (TIGR01509 family)
MTPPGEKPDWDAVEVVLLDMDGTLLDRHFDDHFWEDVLPRRWAEARGLDPGEARALLLARYREMEGRLEWYDVDHWSRELGLDVIELKREVEHLVGIHPHVREFVGRVRATGRPVYLVTNAHARTLAFKMARTGLAHLFDGIVTSHETGFPKEDERFWEALRGRIWFNPATTLLAEDSERILDTARRFGIRFLVHISRPSSRLPERPSKRHFSIADFGEIIP